MAVPDLAKLHAQSWTVHAALEEVGAFCTYFLAWGPNLRGPSAIWLPLQFFFKIFFSKNFNQHGQGGPLCPINLASVKVFAAG